METEGEKTEAPPAEDETETEAPAEGAEPAVDPPAEETPAAADGEAKPEEAKPADKPPEIPEDVLQAAALKFANKTMAAARRAQTATEAVKTENASLKTELGVHKDFVSRLRGGDPMGALQQAGFPTLKAFHEHLIASGQAGEDKPADPLDEVAKLRKERDDEKKANAQREQARVVEESKAKVFAAVDGLKATKYPRTATGYGKRELWDAIEAYHKQHGSVPDAAVWHLADQVERALRAEFGEPSSPGPGAKGTTAAATAATAARTGGKTMTNSSTSGAPARREYSMDPEERRRQVTEDMRAAGEL